MATPISRPATAADLAHIWPAARASKAFDSPADLEAFRASTPWGVRVDGRGGAAIAERWRAHLGVLAIRGLWSSRLGLWLADLREVAQEHGLSSLLSPLLPESILHAWLAEGMTLAEPIVALQAVPAGVRLVMPPPRVSIRRGSPADVAAAAAVDAASFNEFWRFGEADLSRHSAGERFAVAEKDGEVIGYTLCTVNRGSGVLSRLAVAPGQRRGNVGSALLSDVASYVERAGAITLTLCTQESNVASRALYRRAGLTEVEELYGLAIVDIGAG